LDGRNGSLILDASFLAEVTVTAKDTVRALLDRLPDDCSLDDVQYHLYVVQALARGEADEEAGRTIPHEQVDAELRRKWLLGRVE
jgi:predicted transcriptional regulator